MSLSTNLALLKMPLMIIIGNKMNKENIFTASKLKFIILLTDDLPSVRL